MKAILWLLVFTSGYTTAQASTLGQPLPPLAWERVRSQLPKNKGSRLVLLDIWASWCAPCRESFPHYEKTYLRWKKAGLIVVGLNMDSQRELAEEFLREVPVTFPIIYDPDKKLRELLAIDTLPRLYILDESGSILQIVRGSTGASQRELDLFLNSFFKKKQQSNNKEKK